MLTSPHGSARPAIVIPTRARAYVREYYMRLPVKKPNSKPREPIAHPLKKEIDKYVKEHKYVSQHKLKKSAEKKLKELRQNKRGVNYRVVKNKAPNRFGYAVQRTSDHRGDSQPDNINSPPWGPGKRPIRERPIIPKGTIINSPPWGSDERPVRTRPEIPQSNVVRGVSHDVWITPQPRGPTHLKRRIRG